jgi:hypothetical protein
MTKGMIWHHAGYYVLFAHHSRKPVWGVQVIMKTRKERVNGIVRYAIAVTR